MAERFKALVLKTSVGKLTVGSNPSLSANINKIRNPQRENLFSLRNHRTDPRPHLKTKKAGQPPGLILIPIPDKTPAPPYSKPPPQR